MKTLIALAAMAFSFSAFAISTEHPEFQKKLANPEGYVAQSQVADFATDSICGTSDLMYVNDYDGSLGVDKEFVDFNKPAVGKMNGVGCTGTMIGEDLFLTASHCVGGGTVGEEVLFDYEYEVGGQTTIMEYKPFKVAEIVEDGAQYNLDFAVLRLEGTPGVDYGFRSLSKEVLQEGEPITIIQHPGGRPKMIESGTIFGFNPDQLLYGDLDTEGGSSGSGVLNHDGFIVGVHTHGGCFGSSGQNKGTRVEVMAQNSEFIDQLATPPVAPQPL